MTGKKVGVQAFTFRHEVHLPQQSLSSAEVWLVWILEHLLWTSPRVYSITGGFTLPTNAQKKHIPLLKHMQTPTRFPPQKLGALKFSFLQTRLWPSCTSLNFVLCVYETLWLSFSNLWIWTRARSHMHICWSWLNGTRWRSHSANCHHSERSNRSSNTAYISHNNKSRGGGCMCMCVCVRVRVCRFLLFLLSFVTYMTQVGHMT